MTNTLNHKYQASASANVVVSKSKAILHRIIIGKDVATSTIEVSNSATDGDGDVRIFLTGSTLMTATGGCLEVGTVFPDGITVDMTNQTNVTFIWEPTT